MQKERKRGRSTLKIAPKGLRAKAAGTVALALFVVMVTSVQAALAPEVQADILRNQIVKDVELAAKTHDYAAVVADIDKYKALKVGMPPALLLVEAKATHHMGDAPRALAALQALLTVVKRGSREYEQAVALYPDYQIAADKAAKAAAEAAQAAAEAKARDDREAATIKIISEARAAGSAGNPVRALKILEPHMGEHPDLAESRQAEAAALYKQYQAAAIPIIEAQRKGEIDNFLQEISADLVSIPAGSFDMGHDGPLPHYDSNAWAPAHRVIVSSFRVMAKPVTGRQFEKCLRLSGRPLKDPGTSQAGYDEIRPGDATHKGYVSTYCLHIYLAEDRPMEPSWHDANDCAESLRRITGHHFRLLSEAEWEYLARNRVWVEKGNDLNKAGQHFAVDMGIDSVDPKIADQVGAGAYRMGNDEWVTDCWHISYQGAPADGTPWTQTGDCQHRVVRGGFSAHAHLGFTTTVDQSVAVAARRYDEDGKRSARFRLAVDP